MTRLGLRGASTSRFSLFAVPVGFALLASCAQIIGAGDYQVEGESPTGGISGTGGSPGGGSGDDAGTGSGFVAGAGGDGGDRSGGSGGECPADFPVPCPARDGAAADCWTERTDCSSLVACDEASLACQIGYSADCSSDSCFSSSYRESVESTDEACANGLDDDADGFVDCEDIACLVNPSVAVCNGENTNRTCSGGVDEDADGYVDCGDAVCELSPAVTVCGTPELTAAQCSNEIDDNGDGFVDCADWHCMLSLFSGCEARIGDACFTSDKCTSGTCTGYVASYAGVRAGSCTAACTTSAECGASSSQIENHCVVGLGTGSFCYPSCDTIDECIERFGQDSTCATVANFAGDGVSVCVTAREIGAHAFNPAECASGVALGYYCSGGCLTNEECGTNVYGRTNHCVEGLCRAGCELDADCAVYGGAASCHPVTDITGSTANVCGVAGER